MLRILMLLLVTSGCGFVGLDITGDASLDVHAPDAGPAEDTRGDVRGDSGPGDGGTSDGGTGDASDGGTSDASDGGTSDASDGGTSDASDGGTSDAGPDARDAGPDVGAPSCTDQIRNGTETGVDCGGTCVACDRCGTYPGEIFCSSFEDPSFAEWDGRVEENGGALQHETLRSFRGGVLRTTVGGEPDLAYLIKDLPPVETGTIYMRMHMLIEGADLVLGTRASRHFMRYSTGTPGRHMFFSIFENRAIEIISSSDFAYTPAATLPVDRWFCVVIRLGISPNPGMGSMTIVIDGEIHNSGPLSTFSVDGGYDVFHLGMVASHASPNAAHVYFDEFVMATNSMSCD